jgi:hypothetical protein
MLVVRLLPAALATLLFAVACSDPAPSTTGGTSSRQTGDKDDDDDRDSDEDSDRQGESSTTGKGTETADAGPADPSCVANCNTNLKTKCEGDDKFCDYLCSSYTTAEIACLQAAPTCGKDAFIQCAPNDEGGDDNGGGGK